MVALLTHAMFFFPLREVHTAASFWAIMGASAGTSDSFLPYVAMKVTGGLIFIMFAVFVLTVFINMSNSKSVYYPKKKVLNGDCSKHT
jgi:hypothetical protein